MRSGCLSTCKVLRGKRRRCLSDRLAIRHQTTCGITLLSKVDVLALSLAVRRHTPQAQDACALRGTPGNEGRTSAVHNGDDVVSERGFDIKIRSNLIPDDQECAPQVLEASGTVAYPSMNIDCLISLDATATCPGIPFSPGIVAKLVPRSWASPPCQTP